MILIIALIVPYIVECREVQNIQKAYNICTAYGYQVLEAKFNQESHWLCLRTQAIGSSPLTPLTPTLLLDPGLNSEEKKLNFSLKDVSMAYGFPVEDPRAGSAEGYIGDDNQFYGVLHLGNRTLYADPYGMDDPNKFFGAFANDFLAAPERPRREYSQFGNGFDQLPYFPYDIEQHDRKPGVARARICDLLLLADREFFENDANSSLNHVVRRMMHAVAQADVIFRNADFNEDGIPDNVGFSVKYILVLTSNETDYRVFGDLSKERAVDGRSYLMRFARLRRLSEVCLGVAFSGHAFKNKTLGLSFTSLGGGMGGAAGGLCDRRAYGRSFNTLAIAHATVETGVRVPERVAALTLAHEIGHSFGAHHDDNFPNPDCNGYLMGSQSSISSPHSFEFSMCSKRLVAATLSSMSYCLTDVDQAYCGNGIVEDGESCDCGLPSQCSYRDPCCTPRAGGTLMFDEGALHKEGCLVSPSAMCHPSQGLCCKANCEYANLTKSGIDCTSLELQCPRARAARRRRCGVGGRCLPDGSCHAAECALLGLRECACPDHGPGGKLSQVKKCGVCCQLKKAHEDEDRCVGVEFALKEVMMHSKLPIDWPDEYYRGPNVSVTVCGNATCARTHVRAWPAGDVCVALNAVGVCAPRGACTPADARPAANIYPDFVKIKVLRHSTNSTKHVKACIFILFILNSINIIS